TGTGYGADAYEIALHFQIHFHLAFAPNPREAEARDAGLARRVAEELLVVLERVGRRVHFCKSTLQRFEVRRDAPVTRADRHGALALVEVDAQRGGLVGHAVLDGILEELMSRQSQP